MMMDDSKSGSAPCATNGASDKFCGSRQTSFDSPENEDGDSENTKLPAAQTIIFEAESGSPSDADDADEEYTPNIAEESYSWDVVTLRMLFVSSLFNFFISFANQIGNYRTLSFQVSPIFVQILSYPVMKLMELIPSYKMVVPLPFGRKLTLDTNPCPFHAREHMMISVMMADANQGAAYVSNSLYVMETMMGQNLGFFGDFLMIYATKFLGIGLAGFFAKFLLIDRRMSWPLAIFQVETFVMFHEPKEAVPTVQDNAAKIDLACVEAGLHDSNSLDEKRASTTRRLQVFGYFFLAFFIWQWVPMTFAPTVGSIALLCFFSGSNVVSQLGSGLSGFGIMSFTGDLSTLIQCFPQFAYTPAWLGFNAIAGGMFWAWFLSPIFYYTGVEKAQTMPIYSFDLFQANGSDYPLEALFNEQQEWQQDKFELYGVPYGSIWYMLGYGFSFAALSSGVTHAWCHYGSSIKELFFAGSKVSTSGSPTSYVVSKHAERLAASKPNSLHYLNITGAVLTVFTGAIFIMTNSIYDVAMPWWAVIVSVVLAMFFVIPFGIINARTGFQIGLNILAELLGGVMLPHNPNGAILVKVASYMAMSHSLAMISNLKAGQYMGVSYGTVFAMQVWGTLVCCLADTFAYRMVMDANLVDNAPGWSSTALSQFTSAAYMWGGIGGWTMWMNPATSHYAWIFWPGLILGAVLPVVFYKLGKRYYWAQCIHIPMALIMPAYGFTNAWYISGFALIYFFQVYMPKHNPHFYKNYTYVSFGGLSGAIGIVTFIWSMLQGFGNVQSLEWPMSVVPMDNFCAQSGFWIQP